ncbi:MAG: hypothetical protein IPH33_19475 [Bacteroidetes bacterium]|nr:hypothetical protein [Bacteroidota bacterium]
MKLNSVGDTVFTTILSANESIANPSIVQSISDSSFFVVGGIQNAIFLTQLHF